LTPNAPVLENGSLRAWARTHPAPVQPPCKRSRGPLALQDVVAMTVTHSFVRHDACRCREAPHSIRVSGCVCLEKGREREIGGIEMLAPYPYPQADQSHCTSPTSLEIIAVAVAGSGSGDWKWEHPCFLLIAGPSPSPLSSLSRGHAGRDAVAAAVIQTRLQGQLSSLVVPKSST
jgi:hypothetical protein